MLRLHLLFAFGLAGCGAATPAPAPTSAPTPAPSAASPESEASVVEPEATPAPAEESSGPLAIPTSCAGADGVCTPPRSFAGELCRTPSPDLALAMFQRTTPWTRAYVRVPMDAWYTGGRHAAPSRLDPGEEVIIVATHGASGEIQVGGASYDVIRWDGKCVSVMADEVTLKKPRSVTVAPIVWRRLDERVQERLLANGEVKKPHTLMRRMCQSDPTHPACELAQVALSQSIADYVRKGGDLPAPGND